METKYFEKMEGKISLFFSGKNSRGNNITQTLNNLFFQVADSSFGLNPVSTKARAIRTVFRFGFPIQGFTDERDRVERQVTWWAKRNFLPKAFFLDISSKISIFFFLLKFLGKFLIKKSKILNCWKIFENSKKILTNL